MLVLLLVFGVGAVVAPLIVQRLGRRAFFVVALIPLVAFIYTLAQGAEVVAGRAITESYRWIPQLDFNISVRLDTLSWVLALIVTGVGTLVLVYCAAYFRATAESLGRFAATFLAFAGAMYGLVIADDVYLLFVFWEATSVLSYLLIGHATASKASRGAALQALLVTTLGGLVMLVGLVLLSVGTGTSNITRIIELAPSDPLAIVAILLVLVGAISKSAIFPFHFWLPAAMAAPTPVSAYLHAAAMVKAGIYLIARFAPGFADTPGWRESLIALGLVTMLLGGWVALRQHDLKLLLAYGTVSQLGFLTVVVGFGTRDAALAGLALLLAHALYKSTLFLAVGIIDHRYGTRDLRKLSGLGRRSPLLAVITGVALASMMGLPPTLGFVAKETAITAMVTDATGGGQLGLIALIGIVVGSALTVAYGARFFWGAFFAKAGVEPIEANPESRLFTAAPLLLAVSGLALGIASPILGDWIAGYPALFPAGVGKPYELALWHGLEPALFLSAATIVVGAVLFVLRASVEALQLSIKGKIRPADGYSATLRSVDRLAAATTAQTQRGSLPFYLGVILLAFIGTVTTTLIVNRTWPTEIRLWDSPAQLAIAAVMIIAALATTRADTRIQGVILIGVTGFGMAVLFALQGAPDLALTQVLVEVVTLVAFVLVLRRLPVRLGDRKRSVRQWVRVAIGVSFGVVMAVVAVVAAGARSALPVSLAWPDLAYIEAHGRNVVNVALVDLRGWDTMGELAVIIAAATGVASLIFISGRADTLPRPERSAARQSIGRQLRRAEDTSNDERSSWLLAARTLAAKNRSILLEVTVRLIFHSVIVVSVYLTIAGHNSPGGGFAGGLVAGMALVARYLAGGRIELGAAAPIDAGKLLGVGLVLAAGTALVPLFFGGAALESSLFELNLGPLGTLDFVTSTIFDIGVYLVVIGLILDVLRSLGAGVDRQQEVEETVKAA